MFEEIFSPNRCQISSSAPCRRARTISRSSQGERRKRPTLRKCANAQLNAPSEPGRRRERQCRPDRGGGGDLVAAEWTEMHSRGISQGAQAVRRQAIEWLRFLLRLDEREKRSHSHSAEVAAFEKWLRDERGLIRRDGSRLLRGCQSLLLLAGRKRCCAERRADAPHRRCGRHRAHAGSLDSPDPARLRAASKAFFLFAEARGWCSSGWPRASCRPASWRMRPCPKA